MYLLIDCVSKMRLKCCEIGHKDSIHTGVLEYHVLDRKDAKTTLHVYKKNTRDILFIELYQMDFTKFSRNQYTKHIDSHFL